MLNLCSFYKMNLKKFHFVNCAIREVDFIHTDLSTAVFEKCDLMGATFESTNLEGADFRTAFNYALDPEINRVKRAKFSRDGLAGLLHRYSLIIE